MRLSGIGYTVFSAIALLFFSLVAIIINFFCYHYPGNNYFPPHSLYVFLALALMYSGFFLQFDRKNYMTVTLKEIIYFFIVMSLIAFATNATQYTPFPTIDKKIIFFERSLGIDIQKIILWTNDKPLLKEILNFIYDTFPYQMTYFPLFIIITGQNARIREYYFLLLFSTLLGFTFYYFFPTTAPASIFKNIDFSPSQIATGLKFRQLHEHIQPSTLEGGMIALPSFHVIWAWFCVYLLKGVPIAFIIMLPINMLLIASCVLLGWHYPIDVLGGVVIIFIAHGVYYLSSKGIHLEPNCSLGAA